MGKFIDLTGQKFNRLIVLKFAYINKHKSYWDCICDCGNKIIVYKGNLKNGHTKSCGCLQKEIATKHGYNKKGQKTRIYSIWEHIIQRCTNPNNSEYKNYGGRGIKICDRWLNFKNFLKDMGEPPKNMKLIEQIMMIITIKKIVSGFHTKRIIATKETITY
jgi:hypothetical protein